MTTPVTDRVTVDDLLTHVRWVERFSRALVREDSEDVAQDSWLTAIEKPPVASASPRPWLATVMRNAARMHWRSTTRRRAREEAVETTAPEVVTPDELVHRVELQRRLASAVLALPDAQREAIVLVFYEGLSPAEAARRLELPATTVRSRIRVALETLRARLDAEENGDRTRWTMALAPFVCPRSTAAAAAPVTMKMAAAVAALVTGAVVLVLMVVMDSSPAAARGRTAHASAPARTVVPPRIAPPRPSSAPVQRTGVARSSTVPSVPAGTGDEHVDAAITQAFMRVPKAATARLDECYELTHARGDVVLSIAIQTRPDVLAEVEIDEDATTIKDPETLQCLRENTTAIEEQIEQLRAKGERVEGPITIEITRPFPPPPPRPDDWPADSASPTCPAGTSLAGTHGKEQWCEKPDGTKHGPIFQWDPKGRLVYTSSFDNGTPAPSWQMHDPESN